MSRGVTKAKVKTSGSRKTYDDKFKLQVVLEALREAMPLSELASKSNVHPNQLVYLGAAKSASGRRSFWRKRR